MPYDTEPIRFDFTEFDETFKRDRWIIYRHMVQDVFDHLLPHRVEQRQIYAVTGNGPFLEEDVLELFDHAGFYEDKTVAALSDQDTFEEDISFYYMIVGREDFDTALLDWALEQLTDEPDTLLIFSQEDFFNDWLFGRYEPYTRGDPRIVGHPALTYLAEHSGPRWPWPSTEPVPSLGYEVDANGLQRTITAARPIYSPFSERPAWMTNLYEQCGSHV